ncbi:MAG: PQQ-binding-like beta-propeller repeat protein [Thermoguttaceae bacterium]|jgi:outer membrane protein assembly factor BamB
MSQSGRNSNVARLACAALIVCVSGGGDWRQFRGNDNTAVSKETGLPRTFDLETGRNVAWKAPLPGRGPSSPIVVSGRVLVTSSSGAHQDRLHVSCFHAGSGKLLWHRQFWATGHTTVNPFSAVACPTPASDGRRVFALYSSNDLACFDLEGNLQWLRGLSYESPSTRNDAGMSSSPLVVGRTVVVQLENQGQSFALGLEAASGATRWQIPREQAGIWSSPTVLRGSGADRDVVLMQGRSALSAHDPETGRTLWTHPAGCDTIGSVTTCGQRIYLPAYGLHALLSESSGRRVQALWYQPRLRLDNPSPVADGNRVYVVKPPGILAGIDAGDGHVAWQLRLQGPFWATPILADGHLYVVNYDGLVQVVQPGQEGKLVGGGRLDGGILATPAAADGALYFRNDATLWKIALRAVQ